MQPAGQGSGFRCTCVRARGHTCAPSRELLRDPHARNPGWPPTWPPPVEPSFSEAPESTYLCLGVPGARKGLQGNFLTHRAWWCFPVITGDEGRRGLHTARPSREFSDTKWALDGGEMPAERSSPRIAEGGSQVWAFGGTLTPFPAGDAS